MNPIQQFHSAVTQSNLDLTGPLGLLRYRGELKAEHLDGLVHGDDLSRLYAAAAEHAAQHSLSTAAVAAMDDVYRAWDATVKGLLLELLTGRRNDAATMLARLDDDDRQNEQLRSALDELAKYRGIGATPLKETAGDNGESALLKGKSSSGATVNARMIDVLQNNVNAREWTARQWADHLGLKSPASITKQPAWKELVKHRTGEAFASGELDRRKLPKKRRRE